MVDDDHEFQDAMVRLLLAAGWFLVQRDTDAGAWRFHGAEGHSQVVTVETLGEALQHLLRPRVDEAGGGETAWWADVGNGWRN
jgi:hypothetical protein